MRGKGGAVCDVGAGHIKARVGYERGQEWGDDGAGKGHPRERGCRLRNIFVLYLSTFRVS